MKLLKIIVKLLHKQLQMDINCKENIMFRIVYLDIKIMQEIVKLSLCIDQIMWNYYKIIFLWEAYQIIRYLIGLLLIIL